jgi:hypothetical protein
MPLSPGSSILFTAENVNKCTCFACPVQTGSKCVRDKMSLMSATLKQNPLQPQEIPALFCASGKASCRDLNFKKQCICVSCPVFKNYTLKGGTPPLFYCRDGAVQ